MSEPSLPVFTDEGLTTIDEMGNPVCGGCHMTGIGMAAIANSRGVAFGTCACPPADPRMVEPETLAEARQVLHEVLDLLERQGHALTCTCGGCDALRRIERAGA